MAKWIRRRFPEPKIGGSSPLWDELLLAFAPLGLQTPPVGNLVRNLVTALVV